VTTRLYLLRHGEVTSHRGDVPITADGERRAFEVGQVLGLGEARPLLVLTGETRRAMDTGSHLAKGVTEAGADVIGPRVAFALRNPDLYLAGTRVNMVSSADALAEQVEGMSVDEVLGHDFFPEFFDSPDRIGWWLTHESPPGENADAVAGRVRAFAVSLADPIPGDPDVVVAVTHSPLLRAAALDLLGRDIGEPPWVSGLLVDLGSDGKLSAEVFGGDQP
jgi:broad specificity phosphatase PhoE